MQNMLKGMAIAAMVGMSVGGYGETVAFSAHSSDPDNIITNDVHYAKPIAEIANDDVVRYWSEYNSITIRVPEDVTFASTFKTSFYTGKDKYTKMLIDGVWYMPDGTANYPEYNMTVTSLLSLRLNSGTDRKRGAFRFQDGELTFSKTADGAVTTLDWNGDFNFYNPNGGTPLYDNYLYANQESVNHSVYSFSGGTFVAPIVWNYGESLTNDFQFTGGRHFIRRLGMRNHNSGTDDYARSRIFVTGSNTVLKLYNFETETSATTHGYSFRVDDGGTLELTGTFTQREGKPFGFVFDGGNLVVTNQSASDAYWNCPRIAATNATFAMAASAGRSGANNRLWFTGAGQMLLKDTVFNGYCTAFDTDMTMEGGSYTAVYGTSVGGSYGNGTVTFRDASVDFGSGADLAVGPNSDDRSKLVIDGTTSATAENLLCGNSGTSDGTVEIRGGTMTVANRVILGGSGSATLKVTGGRMSAANVYSAWNDASNGQTGRVVVAGGELAVSGSDGITYSIAGKATGCHGVMILTGGTLKTARVKCASNGTGTFVADGGTIVPTTKDADLIQQMATAELGAKGLTVDSDKDVKLSQSFTDLDGADGELILTGSGTKTISGTATTVSKIVVAGGTVVFADGAKAASTLVVTNGATVKFAGDPSAVGLKGVVCGDGTTVGVLAFVRTQTLAVDGPVTLNGVRLALVDDYPIGTECTLLTTTATVTETTRSAWFAALISAGRDASRSYDFTVEGPTAGLTSFCLSVATAAYQATLASGTSNVVEDISVGVCARILAQVEQGATLTFSGSVGRGALQKTGAGRLYLSSADNVFMSGVTSEGGLLSVSCAAALGAVDGAEGGVTIVDGTLEFTSGEADSYGGAITVAAGAKKPVVVKTDGDLTVGGLKVATGDFIKRGVGKLTIAPPSGTTWKLSSDNGATANDWDPTDTTAIAFADDGTVPDHGYLGFNVAEGEVVLKGDATTRFTAEHDVLVGPNVASCDAIQTLTVDGATAELAKYNLLHVGAYTSADAPVQAKAAAFNVVNGADVTVNTFILGRGLGTPNATTCIVDHATLRTGSFRPAYYWGGKPVVIVRNGGRILASDIWQSGSSSITVAGGELAKNADGDGFAVSITGDYGGTWRFSENAYFACHTLTFAKAFNQYNRLTLDFDGGTWKAYGDSANALRLYQAPNLVVRTSGAGLTLPVESTKTVGVARAITGEGGVVKTGAGTLAFETQGTWDSTLATKTPLEDPVSLAFEGTLDVREGAVTVAATACRTGGAYKTAAGASVDFGGNQLGAATFSGAGSFANGSSVGGTLVATLADDGTVGACPSFEGLTVTALHVDFGRTEPPASLPQGLVVATFPNGAPDVSSWRSRHTGKGTRATFRVSANGRDVLADIVSAGFVIMVR